MGLSLEPLDDAETALMTWLQFAVVAMVIVFAVHLARYGPDAVVLQLA